ncbi:MAG: hypothetical protein HC855_16685 [Rhizobiales bacterium]|nr:hypothetical protein [Hyphomicrobiales bacterium]
MTYLSQVRSMWQAIDIVFDVLSEAWVSRSKDKGKANFSWPELLVIGAVICIVGYMFNSIAARYIPDWPMGFGSPMFGRYGDNES